MLEGLDSDALFTLGLVLSEQGKDDESIATYKKSIELNAEDAELAYNLGIKLGEKGDTKGELEMYKKGNILFVLLCYVELKTHILCTFNKKRRRSTHTSVEPGLIWVLL